MATAIIAQYMVSGTIWVESRLRDSSAGLDRARLARRGARRLRSVARGAAVPDAPFAADFHVPLLGAVHLSTVLVFDLGVYMLVVGAAVLMLIALAHQSLRSPRKLVASPADDADPSPSAEAPI